jgi:ribosomal protein S18 acetylase RimI-like enzyme
MTGTVMMRRASSDADIWQVAELWIRSARWLKSQGSDQWQYPIKMENITAAVSAGHCWLANRGDATIGTITVDDHAEPQYWYPEDEPDNALYVHRMVIDEAARGIELGSAMLDWVGEQAQARRREWVRLDAWRSNTALHRYYRERGFELVRVVSDPSGSGACFQRSAAIRLGRGPQLLTLP